MKNYYPNGLDIYNNDSLNGFRFHALQEFGYTMPDDNHALSSAIMRLAVLCDKGIWKYKEESLNYSNKKINKTTKQISNKLQFQ